MKISVTQEHIDKGERARCGSCPVALAIREQTKFKYAKVNGLGWNPGFPGATYRPICREVLGFVSLFDYLIPVKPFEFELEVPA